MTTGWQVCQLGLAWLASIERFWDVTATRHAEKHTILRRLNDQLGFSHKYVPWFWIIHHIWGCLEDDIFICVSSVIKQLAVGYLCLHPERNNCGTSPFHSVKFLWGYWVGRLVELVVITLAPQQSEWFINGHFRNLNWRYLPYIRPIFQV